MSEVLPSVTVLEPTGKPLVDKLRLWAAEYADASNGRMRVMPYDPDTHPGQRGLAIKGEPQDLAIINMIAIEAVATKEEPDRFDNIVAQLEQQSGQSDRIDAIGELLAAGNNVELVTNHSELIDIAVAHAALYRVLHKRGYKKLRTSMIISKMVAFLEYELDGNYMPCVSVLQMLENEIFLSYPKTDSAKKHLEDDANLLRHGTIDTHNLFMRRRIERRLGKGGLLLAMAASGSTDKPLPSDPDTIGLAPVGPGTVKLMQQPRTLVAPMAVWYKDAEPVMEIVDTPRVITKDDDAHHVMHDIAATLSAKVSGKSFSYQTA